MKIKLHKYIAKIILSYLIILLIPSIALMGVYYYTIDYTIQKEQLKNEIILSQTAETIDQKLNEILFVANFFSLSKNTNIRLNQISRNIGGEEFFYIYLLCQESPNFSLTNSLIKDIFFLINDANYIVQLPWAYPLDQMNYDSFVSLNGISFDMFCEMYLNTYHNSKLIVLPPENGDPLQGDILLMHSIPVESTKNVNVNLMITMDNNYLFEALENLSEDFDGIIFATDSKNNIIARVSQNQFPSDAFNENNELNSEYFNTGTYLMTSVSSKYADWTYTMVVSKKQLIANVKPLKNTILILNSLSITLGTIVCIYTVYKKAKSFNSVGKLVSSISQEPSAMLTNEYEFLREAFSEIIKTNSSLSETVDQQKALFDAALIRQIIYNDLKSEEYLQNLLQKSTMDLNADKYCITIMEIKNFDEISVVTDKNLLMVFIKDLIQRKIDHRYFLLDIENNRLVIMLLLDNNVASVEIERIFEDLYNTSYNNFNIELFFAISRFCSILSDIYILVSEAWDLINLGSHTNAKKMLFSKDLTLSQEEYFYPLTVEIKLIQLLRGNEKEKLDELLREVYVSNFTEKKLSLVKIEQLCNSIKQSVIRGVPELSIENDKDCVFKILEDSKSIFELIDGINTINDIINKNSAKQKLEKNESFKNNISEIIQKNFVDPNFNLSVLAALLDVSESQLYKSFKTHFGISFADYLENMRIEMSCRLLSEGHLAIKNIPSMVGYNNDYSFRRAFKRLTGLTPSEYRNAN